MVTQSPSPQGVPSLKRETASGLRELLLCFTSLLQAKIRGISRTGAQKQCLHREPCWQSSKKDEEEGEKH